MNLLQTLTKTNRNVYINVARVKTSEPDDVHVSLALPCLHCRKALIQFTKYRKKKFGKNVYIRYTQDNGTFSEWSTIYDLPESKMSTGWRLKYKK